MVRRRTGLEVGDVADALVGEQLEAAGVDAGERRHGLAGVDQRQVRRDEVDREIDFAVRMHAGVVGAPSAVM